MKEKVTQNLSKSEKVKLVKAKYNIENIKPINFENISYEHKLYLLAIFRVLTDEDFDKILPLNNQNSIKVLSPSRDMDKNIIDCLYTNKVICVDPNSNIQSFQFNDNDCFGITLNEVCWIVNISNENEERLQLKLCFRMIYKNLTKYFPTSIEERNQAYSIIMNLALNEVENYLQFKSNKLDYKYVFGNKTTMYVYQLLKFLSVSEIYSIINISIDEDYLYNSRSDLNSNCYGNTIAARLLEVGEKACRDDISLNKLPRNERLQRSELCKVFYELIHHGNDEGFNECPIDYWSNTLKSYYITDTD